MLIVFLTDVLVGTFRFAIYQEMFDDSKADLFQNDVIKTCKGIANSMTDLDRPLGLPEVEAVTISRQSAHEGGIVVSPVYRPPLPSPRRYPRYSFLLVAESTPRVLVRPEGLSH